MRWARWQCWYFHVLVHSPLMFHFLLSPFIPRPSHGRNNSFTDDVNDSGRFPKISETFCVAAALPNKWGKDRTGEKGSFPGKTARHGRSPVVWQCVMGTGRRIVKALPGVCYQVPIHYFYSLSLIFNGQWMNCGGGLLWTIVGMVVFAEWLWTVSKSKIAELTV